ncbi:FIG00554639: hypothetical protein [Cronobacter sakazakii 696]|nr:FIG00554639: hypothetical protein [Cronobacter sakazakii 696]
MADHNIHELLSQCLAALAGLFGGLSVSFFWQPKKLHQHGRLAAGVIIGAISVSTTFTLGGFISHWLGMNFRDSDIAMGIGYFVGALSVGMIAWVANFFNRREGHDILQVAGELMPSIKLLFWAVTLIDITVAIVIFISALNTNYCFGP